MLAKAGLHDGIGRRLHRNWDRGDSPGSFSSLHMLFGLFTLPIFENKGFHIETLSSSFIYKWELGTIKLCPTK